MNNVINKLLLTSIFLIPLIGAYKGFGYEQIKVLFFIFSITLIGFLWIFRKPKLSWNLIRLASFIFILTLFLISFMGINPKNSFLGTDPYFQGLLVYAYLFLFSLMVSVFDIKMERWATILAGSASLVGFLAIKDWILLNIFHQAIPTYAGRVVSTFGQPNFYAGFLLLSLPFSYFLLKSQNSKLQFLGLGSGVFSYIGIMVSYSRSAILISLVLLCLALVNQLKIKKMFITGSAIALAVAVLLSVILSSGFVWDQFVKPAQSNNPDLTKESVENRIYIWQQALKIGMARPLAGYGLESISFAFSDYFKKNKHFIFEENLNINPVLISLKDLNIDRTHNYILDLFLFSGILGTISWILLVIFLMKKLFTSKTSLENSVILTGFVTYLIWIQFQNQSVVHLIYFWLLVGIIDQKPLDKGGVVWDV